MILVPTYLGPSRVHGIGLFASAPIAKGTVVWRYEEDFDFRLTEERVAALPEVARKTLHHYSGYWNGGYVVSADDARFINHSDVPTLGTFSDPDISVAVRDILQGEELTEDYRDYEERPAFRPELGERPRTGFADETETGFRRKGRS